MLKIIVYLVFISAVLYGQSKEKYFIYFEDKGLSSTILQKNSAAYLDAKKLLSEKAIERRAKVMGAENTITYDDIPVNSDYISQIQNIGIEINNTLNWFNSVSCFMDSSQIEMVKYFPFVKKIEKVKIIRLSKNEPGTSFTSRTKLYKNIYSYDYGASLTQYQLSKIPEVHSMGITGQNIIIGVLDTGFDWKNHESLKDLNVLSEYDFVYKDYVTANETNDSYDQHSHGTYVLSIISGNKEGSLVGPAFNSKYLLAKTEDVKSETTVEEDNYAAALQWMENKGVDITTSSLGYNKFDNNVSHSYSDMDGKTTVITKALELAFEKGVVTISSAGNEGNTSWRYISAPADGFNVLSIGAVSSENLIASFSSRGPTYDGRIKPELTAMGVSVLGADCFSGGYRFASGTSSAAPIVAGVAGLLLSKYPHLNNSQVRAIMLESGNNVTNPDNNIGYGLISALDAICFPNLEFKNNRYYLNKTFKIKPISNIILNYFEDTEIISKNMNLVENNTYEFELPEFTIGSEIGFNFSYTDSNGTVINEPEVGKFKFKYGYLITAKNLDLNDENNGNDYTDLSLQNYPNPFSFGTTIEFYSDKITDTKITIFDILGKKVRVLYDGKSMVGKNSVEWDGKNDKYLNCSSGIYIYSISLGSDIEAKKMILIR